MNESDIVQKGNPVLEKSAKPVAEDEIESNEIQQIIADMKSALHATDDGVAIAAPQIGQLARIFVVNSAVFANRADVDNEDKVFINPEIINTSSETVELEEGCLSVRDIYGKIERSSKATIRALDESGNSFEMGASGLLAQIFQHETDHLDGTLFVDKAYDLREIDRNEAEEKKDE